MKKIEKLRFEMRTSEPKEELKNQHHPESIYVDLLEHRFTALADQCKKVGDGVTDFMMWF